MLSASSHTTDPLIFLAMEESFFFMNAGEVLFVKDEFISRNGSSAEGVEDFAAGRISGKIVKAVKPAVLFACLHRGNLSPIAKKRDIKDRRPESVLIAAVIPAAE